MWPDSNEVTEYDQLYKHTTIVLFYPVVKTIIKISRANIKHQGREKILENKAKLKHIMILNIK